jgi:hypothetical protein
MPTPKVTRTLFDNNLDRSVPQGPTNRRVVILGTASDGPMFEPVRVNSPAEAESYFGAFNANGGTLVRGLKECLNAQAGTNAAPDTYGMRIGNINAAKAQSALTTTASAAAMALEAINNGTLYNDITIGLNGADVEIYNPKTGLISKFDSSLTAVELAAAINAGVNTKDLVFAVADVALTERQIEFVADWATTPDGMAYADNVVSLTLPTIAAAAGLNPYSVINDVYRISYSTLRSGNNEFRLNSGDPAIHNLTPAADLDLTAAYEPILLTALDTTDDGADFPEAVYYSGTLTLEDITIAVTDTITIADIVAGAEIYGYQGDAFDLLTWGSDLDGDLADNVYIKRTTMGIDKPVGSVDPTGITGDIDVTSTAIASGVLTLTDGLDVGDVITLILEFNTSKVPKVVQELATPLLFSDYKINDDKLSISFGAPVVALNMTNILTHFRYASKETLESSSYAFDAVTEVLSITDNNFDPSSATDDRYNLTVYGIDYVKAVDAIDWTLAYAFAGGKDGINMNNSDLFLDLEKAYETFVNDFFDILCVTDLTVDAIVSSGVSAGFAAQMSGFLNTFNGEMLGVIGFEPLVGSGIGGRIKRYEDILDPNTGRVTKLTTVTNDAADAGSLLANFNEPFMFAVDIEPIFSAKGVRYSAIGTCAVAGMMATMPTEEAIYRQTMPGALGLRYNYTGLDPVSKTRLVDLLSDARISVGTIENGSIQLTESRTLATAGSDYENLMTVLIIQEALEICRSVAKSFIGKVSSAPLLQAFQASLDQSLGTALVPRVLRGFNAPISMTPGERVIGNINIPLTLSTQFEIRDIHYNVQLTADDLG